MRTQLSLLVVLLCLASPAAAVDRFVNNQIGHDRNDGRHPQQVGPRSGPVRTIGRALELVQKSDRIVIAETGEPYRECLSLSAANHTGSPNRPLIIEGNGATLDGSFAIPPTAWEHYRGNVFRYRPARLGHQMLFLNDLPAKRQPAGGDPAALEELEWQAAGAYVYFRVGEGKLPENYNLRHAVHDVGITLDHVHDLVIVNLTIQGYRLDGINAFDANSDCLLGGLVCRGNGRSGIAVGGASRVTIDSSLLGNNGEAQLLTEGLSVTGLREVELLEETAPGHVQRGGKVEKLEPRPEE